MSKIKTYLYITAISALIIAAGFLIPITPIKSFCLTCFGFAQQNILIGAAAICAFVFWGNKNYWFILAGCAIVAALAIQFIIVGHNTDLITWVARITAFMGIAFLMNFAKVLINR